MRCVGYGDGRLSKAGHDADGRRRYHRGTGGKRRPTRTASAFAGYRFPDEIIGPAVRWYLILAQRGLAGIGAGR